MSELKWNETDFIECLEVYPINNEIDTEYLFLVQQNGLELKLTVWQHESVVYLDLCRIRAETSLVCFALFIRNSVIYRKEKDREYLYFQNSLPAPSRFSYMDYQMNILDSYKAPYGINVSLSVKPDIKIEFEREKV